MGYLHLWKPSYTNTNIYLWPVASTSISKGSSRRVPSGLCPNSLPKTASPREKPTKTLGKNENIWGTTREILWINKWDIYMGQYSETWASLAEDFRKSLRKIRDTMNDRGNKIWYRTIFGKYRTSFFGYAVGRPWASSPRKAEIPGDFRGFAKIIWLRARTPCIHIWYMYHIYIYIIYVIESY